MEDKATSDGPQEARTQRPNVEDKATQISDQAPRRLSTSEQRGIRPRGLSLQDRPQGLSRSETMPEPSNHQNLLPQSQARQVHQPTITHTTIPVQLQPPSTRPIPKPIDITLPLPRFNRKPSKSPPPPKPPLHVKSHTNPTKQAKTKLNLLNPISLLARRRSPQAVDEASRDKNYRIDDPSVAALSLPDNYDPRIRGNVVHDFDSGPRSGRSGLHSETGTPPKSAHGQDSQNTSQHTMRGPATDEDSPEKEHTPIFKEHFDDGSDSWQERSEGLAKTPKSGFMYKVALQEPGPRPDPSSLPAFARNLPSSFPANPEPVPRVASPPRAPLEVVLEAALSESLPKDPSIISSPPTSPSSKARSRASSNTEPSCTPAGLPKHCKSNASRFSFDLAGVGSTAQEQLLEDKHRQKAKERKEKARASEKSATSAHDEGIQDEDEGSDFDDDMMDDDGLEEKIPGVNADADDEVLLSKFTGPDVGALIAPAPIKSAFVNSVSPVSESLSSPDTSQHLQDRLNGSEHPLPLADIAHGQKYIEPGTSVQHDMHQSKKVVPEDVRSETELPGAVKPLDAHLPERSADDEDDDDMYFDDGMIEHMDDEDGPAFDESQFDDETSRVYGIPIRDLTRTDQSKDISPVQNDASNIETLPIAVRDDTRDDGIAEELRDSLPDLNRPSRPVFSHTAGLTQDNLAAYHDALAFATNQAALNGKFVRQHMEGLNEDPDEDLLPVGESPSLKINGLPLLRPPAAEDYDFDDALSDDPIIAAANAEALENDDDGFYGQEFGFFARANGAGEYANGGYFGHGVMRTHSGRNAEPALTPITERSEWSNRNSAINLALHGYSQVSLPQPSQGLAQLADMMPLEEDNMSLSALMKLRRGAWGGSTTSLQSSSGTSGSPLNYHPSAALQYQQQQRRGSYPPVIMQQGMSNSTYSLNSSNGDSSAGSDNSHTITLPNLPSITIPPNPAMNAPYMQPSYSNSGSDSSPVHSRPRSGLVPVKGKGHSRHGSGDKESVSYVHERDKDGERWVLEKRRVSEGGVVEVMGREVVEGGRI